MNKAIKIGLTRKYDDHVENFPSQKLDKTLGKVLRWDVQFCHANNDPHLAYIVDRTTRDYNRTRNARNWIRASANFFP